MVVERDTHSGGRDVLKDVVDRQMDGRMDRLLDGRQIRIAHSEDFCAKVS